MKKVNILGTEYDLIRDDSLAETEHDGICRQYTKEIRVRNAENMLDSDDTILDKRKRYDEVLRHEIIHAFFTESGLDDYGDNEQLVQWLAIQFPKMMKVFKMLSCTGNDLPFALSPLLEDDRK